MKLLPLLLLCPAVALSQGLTTSPPGGGLPPQTRKNYVLQSNSASASSSAVSPWTLGSGTLATASAPTSVGGGTWAVLTGTSGDALFQTVTVPSSTAFVISAWVAASSGTTSLRLSLRCGAGTAPACACARSDGGACTAQNTNTQDCEAQIVSGLGTTPVKLSGIVTCTSASTAPLIIFYPSYSASSTTTRITGAQIEVGVTKASRTCVTTTASRTCTK